MNESNRVVPIEDAIRHCRSVASGGGVVKLFAEKVLNASDEYASISAEDLVEIVDNWPDACQPGRDSYLALVNVQRTLPRVLGPRFVIGLRSVQHERPYLNNEPVRNSSWINEFQEAAGVVATRSSRGLLADETEQEYAVVDAQKWASTLPVLLGTEGLDIADNHKVRIAQLATVNESE